MELRDYQERAVTLLRESIRDGKRRPLMVLPTGGGKSHIYAQIIKNVVENGKRVLWLVHRRNLVYQMKDILEKHFDVHPAMIMAGKPTDTDNPVQLCTIQTYSKRLQLDDPTHNRFFVDADIILHDEAHRSISKTSQGILAMYPDKIISGCTATPLRADQRGLGEVYDNLIEVATTRGLTEAGYLAPARYFVPEEIDLDGVKVSMGDYVVGELARRTNKPKLIGKIVDNWLEHAENRKTLVFCVNVKHSLAVKEAFERAGVSAAHLDARSSDDERDRVFDEIERGKITVLCNVAVYQEGLDVPSVGAIVMARPTKSIGLWRQCGGRGLRVSEGQKDVMVFDHGNVIHENGLLTDDIEWSLSGKERAWAKKPVPKERQPAKCSFCLEVFTGTRVCPTCGTELKTYSKDVETLDAKMKELNAKSKPKWDAADKRRWYAMFKWHYETVGKAKGWKEGWIAHKYKERIGVWPKNMSGVLPVEPDREFSNWMRHVNIKWAKRRTA